MALPELRERSQKRAETKTIMNPTIHLGFEVGTGQPVAIPLRHTGVTGQTQQSGKTTTLEGLITRSGLRAVAFVTKRGESSFHVMNPIKPYFRERTDWQFVQAVLEATMSERLKFQRAWIMRLCRNEHTKNEQWPAPKTLADVQANVQKALEKARGMNQSVYTELDEYLSLVIPQIQRLPYSSRLELQPGVNVMDLASYDFPLQALVIRSVIEWIHKQENNTITVIPEAWKFAPKQRNSPVRLAAEELIREGGALKNFIWLDSQDLAGVADVLVRQIGVWILGVQRARHEVERTLDHIPDDIHPRPKKADIMRLERGQFIVCWEGSMFKVYVQPAWMTDAHAEAIARGEENVDSAKDILRDYDAKNEDKIWWAIPEPVGMGHSERIERGEVENDPAIQNAPVHDLRGRGTDSGGTHRGAPDSAAQRDDRATVPEEEMNLKRILEALKLPSGCTENDVVNAITNLVASHDALAEQMRSSVAAGSGPEVGQGKRSLSGLPRRPAAAELEEIWLYIKMRASKDPEALILLAQKPELRVHLETPILNLDTSSLYGRMAQLVHEGFFKNPKPYGLATDEAIRRGWCAAKTPKMRTVEYLDRLAGMGFLTREPEGYQAVPGMKITVQTKATNNG